MASLATCTVTHGPSWDAAHNAGRLALFREALDRLRSSGTAFFALPAGFLYAPDWATLATLKDEVVRRAEEANLAVAVGIDLNPAALPSSVRLGAGLSAFTIGWSPASGRQLWVQRSSSSANHHLAGDAGCSERRVLEVAGRPVGVLLCGEIFNPRIRTSVVRQGMKVVVDLGHVSRGFRVFSGMKILTRGGVDLCLCSVHAGHWAQKYCYGTGAISRSTRSFDFAVGAAPRIEVRSWQI
jgi:hypothetical protein